MSENSPARVVACSPCAPASLREPWFFLPQSRREQPGIIGYAPRALRESSCVSRTRPLGTSPVMKRRSPHECEASCTDTNETPWTA
jgi:hypothetical protein